jgi:hypothetical protein
VQKFSIPLSIEFGSFCFNNKKTSCEQKEEKNVAVM